MALRKLMVLAAAAAILTYPFGAQGQEAKEVKAVVDAENAFAVSLYGRLAAQEGNLFLSPGSIHAALTMTYIGAKGQTADQMHRVLALPIRVRGERVGPPYKALLDQLQPPKKGTYELSVANALWGQKGYPWEHAFLEVTKRDFDAGLREVDFAEVEPARAHQPVGRPADQ